ncbi:MAG TPA: hypothetical protein VIC84_21140 [Blastocatellia bacterium]|jgi:hypothetical protein
MSGEAIAGNARCFFNGESATTPLLKASRISSIAASRLSWEGLRRHPSAGSAQTGKQTGESGSPKAGRKVVAQIASTPVLFVAQRTKR